jgi:hypothetical protein
MAPCPQAAKEWVIVFLLRDAKPKAAEKASLTLASDDCNVLNRDGLQWCPAEWEKEIVAARRKPFTES